VTRKKETEKKVELANDVRWLLYLNTSSSFKCKELAGAHPMSARVHVTYHL